MSKIESPIERERADEYSLSPQDLSRLCLSLDALGEHVHAMAVAKGWWEEPRNAGELIALMHSELSEALEGLRKPGPDQHCPEHSSVAIELSDVIVRILDFASAMQINIGAAMHAKIAFNATRPHRHGGKKF